MRPGVSTEAERRGLSRRRRPPTQRVRAPSAPGPALAAVPADAPALLFDCLVHVIPMLTGAGSVS